MKWNISTILMCLIISACQTAAVDLSGKFNGQYYIGDMYNSTRCTSGNYTSGAPLRVVINNGSVSGSHSNRDTAKPLTGKAYEDGTVQAKGFLYVHRTGAPKFTFVDGKIEGDTLVAKVDQMLADRGARCNHGTYMLKKTG